MAAELCGDNATWAEHAAPVNTAPSAEARLRDGIKDAIGERVLTA
jgi:hypothetical protein